MIDRNVEFPNRFRMTLVPGTDDIYEVVPAPGDVIAAGDTFSKANMLPDSITAMLGLKMSNPQVADALNVLANVGNLHVWERVQTYADPVPEVPARYTLGEVVTGKFQVASYNSNNSDSVRGCAVYYVWDDLTLTYDGEPDLSAATEKAVYGGGDYYTSVLLGKFILLKEIRGYNCTVSVPLNGNEVLFIPSDAVLTHSANDYESGDDNMYRTWVDRYQPVSTYPYTPAIPAGTTTDYLTSTDRNAYPDNVTDAQDAYYTLGDVVTGSFYMGIPRNSYQNTYTYSSSLSVSDDGTVSLANPSTATSSQWSPLSTDAINSTLVGKFVQWTCQDPNNLDTKYPFNASPSPIIFIPSDAKITVTMPDSNERFTLSKYQPVTGHAAIPANTTITYLGKIGRPGVVLSSYRGTGAYGQGSPTTLHFEKLPNVIFISGHGDETTVLTSMQTCNIVVGTVSFGDYATTHSVICNVLVDGNTVKLWSTTDAYAQMNQATEYFVAAFYL